MPPHSNVSGAALQTYNMYNIGPAERGVGRQMGGWLCLNLKQNIFFERPSISLWPLPQIFRPFTGTCLCIMCMLQELVHNIELLCWIGYSAVIGLGNSKIHLILRHQNWNRMNNLKLDRIDLKTIFCRDFVRQGSSLLRTFHGKIQNIW